MYIQLDSNNYITGYATVGGIVGGVEAPDTLLEQIDPEKIGYYTYIGGVVTFDETKYNANVAETAKKAIRERRATECFPIINRGRPWYDLWTPQQYTDLKNWYTAWLDAPQTGVIPTRPPFLTTDPA
jgi:hypothetical protein